MPIIFKVIISILVAAIAAGAHFFRDQIGLGAPVALIGGLAGLMILGLWMFPEPRKEKRERR